MSWKGTIKKIDDYRWEIPQDYKPGMRTSAVIYSNDKMIEHVLSDNSPEQAANVAVAAFNWPPKFAAGCIG